MVMIRSQNFLSLLHVLLYEMKTAVGLDFQPMSLLILLPSFVRYLNVIFLPDIFTKLPSYSSEFMY